MPARPPREARHDARVNTPNPALVTERGARALPRAALWLIVAAYVLPGVFGRDPWRNADLAAFGQMAAIAEGRTSWWMPTLGGVAGDAAALPHWLGAVFIKGLAPGLDAALAARIPFALLLLATIALVWYATYHLARTEPAQPLPLAFGGGAAAVDYARAIADGAVLALMASLGLLQLGHETTPELAQLGATAALLYGLAAGSERSAKARAAVVLSLPALAGSGAPAMAVAMGAASIVICLKSADAGLQRLARWAAAGTLLAVALAWLLGAWRWRVGTFGAETAPGIVRQWAWFMWPGWLFALWTLWRWRRQLLRRHIAVPLVGLSVALATNIVMAGSDRALMLALPPLAVLAALALPTLRRSTSAAVDWFSMLFFSAGAILAWLMFVAMHTGWPAKPAANVAKLVPDYAPALSAPPVALAVAGTIAWLWLLRWRTGRHREALWKSLVLPAAGVVLCWLLVMTLWLPVLDFARSPRVWVQRIAAFVPQQACVALPGGPAAAVAALEHFGRWRVHAQPGDESACDYRLVITRARPMPAPPPGFEQVAQVRRPAEREERTLVFRRIGVR
jgi:hypothetical protein